MKKCLIVVGILFMFFTANSFAAKNDNYTVQFLNVSSGSGSPPEPETTSPMQVSFSALGSSEVTCTGKCAGDFKKGDVFALTFKSTDGFTPEGSVKFSYATFNPDCLIYLDYFITDDPGTELRVLDGTQIHDNVAISTYAHCK